MKSLNPDCSENVNITSDQWINHYKQLLNIQCNNNNAFHEYVVNSLPIIENANTVGPLDFDIYEQEVFNSISSLKAGKSDSISNDMLKAGANILAKPLCRLFNKILQCGNFPNSWGKSMLIPIFKSGDVHDVNNYRGIVISSCISKAFIKKLHERLNCFCTENILSDNQCGFRDLYRTDDNIFSFNTLVESYVHHKKDHCLLRLSIFVNVLTP